MRFLETLRGTVLADYRRTGGWAGIVHGAMFLAVPLIEIIFGRGIDPSSVAAAARAPWFFALLYLTVVVQGASVLALAWALERAMRDRLPQGLRRTILYTGLAGGAVWMAQGLILTIGWPILGAIYHGSHARGLSAASGFVNVTGLMLDLALTGYGLWVMFGTWYAQVAGLFGRGTNYTGFFWGFAALFLPYVPILAVAQFLLGIPWAFLVGWGFFRSRQAAPAEDAKVRHIEISAGPN